MRKEKQEKEKSPHTGGAISQKKRKSRVLGEIELE